MIKLYKTKFIALILLTWILVSGFRTVNNDLEIIKNAFKVFNLNYNFKKGEKLLIKYTIKNITKNKSEEVTFTGYKDNIKTINESNLGLSYYDSVTTIILFKNKKKINITKTSKALYKNNTAINFFSNLDSLFANATITSTNNFVIMGDINYKKISLLFTSPYAKKRNIRSADYYINLKENIVKKIHFELTKDSKETTYEIQVNYFNSKYSGHEFDKYNLDYFINNNKIFKGFTITDLRKNNIKSYEN